MSLFNDLLTYTSPLVLLLGSFCGCYYWKWIDKKRKLILSYLIMSLGIDIVSRIVLASSENNLFFLPLYSACELLIISSLYYYLGTKKALVIPLAVLGVIYIAGEMVYVDSYNVKSFQSYAKIVSSFILVLFALQFFMEKLKSDKEISKDVQRLNSAILGYFALNLILLLPINLLINQFVSSVIYIWYAYLGATVLFYAYLSFFIWKNGKTQKQLHSG